MIHAKAAISNGAGGFSIEEIEVHSPTGHEVLVEIKASGVCHTDWDSLNWGRPVVIGHEGAGIVREVGERDTRVVPGDAVLSHRAVPCGLGCKFMHGRRKICKTCN